MNNKVVVVVCAACLALGLYLGKTMFATVETKEVQKEVVRKDIVTVVKEVVRPDGTKETETISTDKSVEKSDKTVVMSAVNAAPNWFISASLERNSLDGPSVYGVQVERRILGPFSLGVRVNTEKTVGLVIGMEF